MRRAALMIVMAVSAVACSDEDDPAIATTTTSSVSTSTSNAASTVSCKTVAFTPNSEDAASSVTATGLACEEAEAFVRIAGAQTSSGGPSELEVEGYRCVLTSSTDEPLPQASYECTSGSKTVTFVRT